MRRIPGLFASALFIAGCASPSPQRAEKRPDELLAAVRAAAEFRKTSYKIGPGDVVSVTVYPDPQFNRKQRVEADGRLSLPLIGPTAVAGSTLREAQERIEKKLANFLVRPHVSLVVEEFGNRQLFVLGEVQKPGSYPIPPGASITALQAISTAGGFTNVAAPQRTQVLRYVGGKSVDRQVDLKAVTRGELDADVLLEPNDILYVPQSFF